MFLARGLSRQIPAVKRDLQTLLSFKRYKESDGDVNWRREVKPIGNCRVAIIGLGGVGKSLAHLLKMYPGGLTEIRLCNRTDPDGVVEELSHIPTNVNIQGFKGVERFPEGLKNVDIVLMCAGLARKKDTPREELFKYNATICSDVMKICADMCPTALIAIVTNPVDSLVPVAAEILKSRGVYRPGRLFGVCQLDQMRAQTFYADAIGAEPAKAYVPVVGGHSELTTVPLFSKGRPKVPLTTEETLRLVHLVRGAGKKVVQAKQGAGGSTYSMASAAMYFVHKLCRAVHHEPHLIISAYVESSVTTARFFSNELLLGPGGVTKNLGYGEVTELEQEMIEETIAILQVQIAKGEEFAAKNALV